MAPSTSPSACRLFQWIWFTATRRNPLVASRQPEADTRRGGNSTKHQAGACFRFANGGFMLADKSPLGQDASRPCRTIFNRQLHHLREVKRNAVGELRHLLAATEAVRQNNG